MKKKTAGKIILPSVLVCFFLHTVSSNVLAVDEADLQLPQEGLTLDEIEQVVEEINFLQEALYAALFYPDDEKVIVSDEECSQISALSSLYLLRGVTLAMSLLGDIVQANNRPPQNALRLITLQIQLVRKVIDLVTVSSNALLIFIQYKSCQQSLETD